MMTLNDIIYYAEFHYLMDYVGQKQLNGQNVIIFCTNENSKVKDFIQYFSPYKAQKLHVSHNENELYGLVVNLL